jgi:hypothetical protein
MADDRPEPFWPSWNSKHGHDTLPDVKRPIKARPSLQEMYEAQRAWEKDRLKGKKPPS